MNKREYRHLEQCFYKLLDDYDHAQSEIKELKDTVELLKAICHANNVEVPDFSESDSF